MFVMPVTRAPQRPAFKLHARDLSRAIDSLFERSFDAAPARASADTTEAPRRPALDVREADGHYTVELDMPGVGKEAVKVTIEGARVSIEAASTATRQAVDGEKLLLSERRTPAYARSFVLPVEVDEDASQARLENGVLSVKLVKKTRPSRQVQVN